MESHLSWGIWLFEGKVALAAPLAKMSPRITHRPCSFCESLLRLLPRTNYISNREGPLWLIWMCSCLFRVWSLNLNINYRNIGSDSYRLRVRNFFHHDIVIVVNVKIFILVGPNYFWRGRNISGFYARFDLIGPEVHYVNSCCHIKPRACSAKLPLCSGRSHRKRG
jgi:hypothetical protein